MGEKASTNRTGRPHLVNVGSGGRMLGTRNEEEPKDQKYSSSLATWIPIEVIGSRIGLKDVC